MGPVRLCVCSPCVCVYLCAGNLCLRAGDSVGIILGDGLEPLLFAQPTILRKRLPRDTNRGRRRWKKRMPRIRRKSLTWKMLEEIFSPFFPPAAYVLERSSPCACICARMRVCVLRESVGIRDCSSDLLCRSGPCRQTCLSWQSPLAPPWAQPASLALFLQPGTPSGQLAASGWLPAPVSNLEAPMLAPQQII